MLITLSTATENQGFFTTYKTLNTTHFNNLFGELSENETTDLDNLLVDGFGESYILEKFADIYDKTGALSCLTRLVKTCDLIFYNQWIKIKETIASGLLDDIEKPLTETTTISQNGTNNTENLNNTTNKIYAFDSDTPNDNGKTEFSGSTDNNTTINRTETIEKSNGLLKSENAQKVIDFTKYNDFLLMVLIDIKNTVCLSIY
jgi:hypothetical protein